MKHTDPQDLFKAANYVVGRNKDGSREFFVGLEGEEVLCSPVIFEAFLFSDINDAEACSQMLRDNELSGFTPSMIFDSGVSDTLKGAGEEDWSVAL